MIATLRYWLSWLRYWCALFVWHVRNTLHYLWWDTRQLVYTRGGPVMMHLVWPLYVLAWHVLRWQRAARGICRVYIGARDGAVQWSVTR